MICAFQFGESIYPSAVSSVLCIITQFTLAYLLILGSVSSLLWRGRHAQQMRTLYFCFFFLSFFPRLISGVADWMSTILLHMVWLSANLECRSEMCCMPIAEMQDPKNRQNSPSGHHRATSSGYILATKARIDNRKKIVKQHCPPNVLIIWH